MRTQSTFSNASRTLRKSSVDPSTIGRPSNGGDTATVDSPPNGSKLTLAEARKVTGPQVNMVGDGAEGENRDGVSSGSGEMQEVRPGDEADEAVGESAMAKTVVGGTETPRRNVEFAVV